MNNITKDAKSTTLMIGINRDLDVVDDWEGATLVERKHSVKTFEEIMSSGVSEKEWLIEGIVGPKDIAFIVGPPSCGKTFLMIDLAMNAIDGREWADAFTIKRPLKVGMVVGEGGSSIMNRLHAAALHTRASNLDNLYIFENGLQFYDTSDDEEYEALFREWEFDKRPSLDLLIVDTFAMATIGADENSAKSANIIIANAKRLADHFNCAVIFVHHTTKYGNVERGSSSLRGAADFMMAVESGVLSCTKAKHSEEFTSKHFSLVGHAGSLVVSWSEGEDNMIAKVFRVLEASELPMTINDICEESGLIYKTVSRSLKQLLTDGKVDERLTFSDKVASKSNPKVYEAIS